jgi:Nif-specific regulatory protein
MGSSDDSDFDRVRLERDLYLGLLGLNDRDDPDAFLEEALGLIVRVLDAEQAYLEVSDPDEGPTSWRAAGCSDEQVEVIRTAVSRGIIAEAIALGDVLSSPSAILDPRFQHLPSVQASKIEAFLCAPIIRTTTPLGVLYIQGRRGTPTFSDQEVVRARTFARYLAPLVESLFIRARQRRPDHVAPFRKRLSLEGVVGTSAALGAVLREVELVSPLDVSVLITGETGTGKSQLARVIHENGPRRPRPFVELNCAAFPQDLLESELFGAVPGAFSGATRREGRVAAAQGGTLFLDEVGEMTLAHQAKLLTFLNTREYFPLGSKTPLTADVRIIAATNADLEEQVSAKRFRADLFFRLQVLRIRIPSLAERPEDVIPLALHLCERVVKQNRLPCVTLSPGALRALEAAEWEGNVRALANRIERAAIRASGDRSNVIETKHIFEESSSSGPRAARPPLTFQEETRRFQASIVQRALDSVDWNVTQAAEDLDLTRAHVYNLIRAFGLKRRSRVSAPQGS